LNKGMVAVALVVVILTSTTVGYFVWVSSQPACPLAPKGSTLYIRITHDGARTPVTNVTIDATPVETCNGVNTTIAILMQPPVNSSGIATLDASFDIFLSVTVHYGSQSYPFNA